MVCGGGTPLTNECDSDAKFAFISATVSDGRLIGELGEGQLLDHSVHVVRDDLLSHALVKMSERAEEKRDM